MNPRPKALDILAEIPGPASDEALLAGIPEVGPQVQSDIVDTILKRGTEFGMRGLAPIFNKLNDEARIKIVTQAARMFGALRECICDSNPQTRQNTLDIVRASANPRLAYLAAHAIHDGSQKIRTEAAAVMLELTNRHIEARSGTLAALRDALDASPELAHVVTESLRVQSDEHKFLVAALKEALDHYESHHRPEVVEASMLLATDLESSLFDQATIKRGKLSHAMAEILGGELDPRFVPFIYVAMNHAEMRRRLVPKIASCRNREFFVEFIKLQWMARDAEIQKSLLYVKDLEWIEDGLDAAFNLPADAAVHLPSWLLKLGLSSNQKVALLLNFLIVDNPKANRAAVWALVDIDTPASTSALEGLVEHENETIRSIARNEVARRTHQARPVRRKIDSRGRPPQWVQLLDRAGLKEEFEDFWQNFEHIHPGQAQTAGRHALKFVNGFATQVQIKLLSQNAADRFRALRLVMALNLAGQFEKIIFTAANDRTVEIRAASMTALGQIGGETSRRILERGLADPVEAVQASAINALDHMDARRRDELVGPKIESDDADVRAAAVRCLLKMRKPAAATALIQMLHDPRPEHRCAALWIVDQLRLTTLSQRVQNIAQSDSDPRIARVAMHVIRRLNHDETSAAARSTTLQSTPRAVMTSTEPAEATGDTPAEMPKEGVTP